MKCIQSIKATKHVEVGEIKRVSDKEADSEVKGGYWKYIPKNEWKLTTRKTKTVNEKVEESKEVKKTNKKK
jgi:hypothetical protein